MAYTPATKLPDIQIIELNNQSFASSLNTTSTTVNFSKAILDYNGDVVTKEMIIKGLNKSGETENIYIPANGLSGDGKTATNVVRGIRLDGLDYTTGDSTLTKEFDSGDKIVCPVNAVLYTILMNVLYGNVASGGDGLIIGDETAGTKTISRSDGTVLGWLRHNGTRVQFSDNGTDWISNSDSIASALVKISATDTTEGYLEDKIEAGTNVTLATISSGANEKLRISAESRREGVVNRETYTPAFYTGGTSAETNISLWNDVSDGSFRVTIDGTTYNVDGLDFTAGPVTTMEEVASVIQSAVRTLTGSDETVTWNTNRLIINSADTTSSSEVNTITTSTGTVGTDISGGTWTDLASGSETVAVLNIIADAGKVPLLNASGKMNVETIVGAPGVTGQVLTVQASGTIGAEDVAVSTILDVDTTDASFVGASEETIHSYTIPANTLVGSTGLRISIPIKDYVTQSQDMTLRVKLNSNTIAEYTTVGLVGTQNAYAEALIFANGDTEQKCLLRGHYNGNDHFTDAGALTEDGTSNMTLTITSQTNSPSATIVYPFISIELIQ